MVHTGRWNGGWGNRDFDAQPGRTGESRQYANIYDRRSEQEYTNRLPVSVQIRYAAQEQQLAAEERAVHEALLEAQSRVHMFPAVGKFIIPEENTWAAHSELVKNPSQSLGFNPEKFVYFDKIIADRLGMPELTDPNHPDYAKYEALRTNLAVMRNDTIGMYVDDGSFDPGDEIHVPKIAGIAVAIAEGLKNDKRWKRPFVRALSMDVANVEGVGAREIYKYLLSIQTKPAGRLEGVRQRVNALLDIPDRNWGIDPIENTPYSNANLAAPPPKAKVSYTAEELASACAAENNQLIELSETTSRKAYNLRSVETLEPPTRESSIEEARKILRWLRNLQFGDHEVEEWVGHGAPVEQVTKAQALSRLAEIYSDQLYKASRTNPSILEHFAVTDASNAVGAMALGLTLHSVNVLPEGHPGIERLDNMLDAVPEACACRESQSVNRLLESLEIGLQHVSGLPVADKSPSERLVEFSGRLRHNAIHLRSVDYLDPPAREESIELAREILRRLKNLRISDKPVEELVTQGTPEEKAQFAQKIDEMVDMYKNLIAETSQAHPDILKDPLIKDANDAVGSFAYAISLMAAKEIPNSIAAAQQISADVTQMPEEWKDLHHRTVGRLVQSMEGGLEQAAQDLAMQQQEQQQDEEVTQESVENNLLQTDQLRRRRRKRRKTAMGVSPSSAAKRRSAQDLNGDGVLDRLQGLNLRGNDLIAVRQLGDNLRTISDQTKDLQPFSPAANVNGIATVANDEQVSPDDRNFAVRERDQRTNPSQRPRDRL